MPFGSEFRAVLDAAAQGSEWALSALYRELQPRLLRYLHVQEPSDAEDLASEVWLDVAAGLAGFEGDEEGFGAWVFTIARRRVLDLRRRNGRRRTDAVPPASLQGLEGAADCETEALAALSLRTALARLAALPRDQAEVLALRVIAGLDVAQVATIVGKRPGTVRVLQHRGLDRLARLDAAGAVTQLRPETI